MKNKSVIKVLIMILIILLLFMLIKIYHFAIVKHVFDAVENFKNQENRAYLVTSKMDENIVLLEETLLKEKIIKYANKRNDLYLTYEWKNFENNERYSFNIMNKEIYKDDIVIEDRKNLLNFPSFLNYLFKGDKINLSEIFDIYYIVPTKYEDKSCYKIATKKEIIIIDKDTYLPVYSSIKRVSYDNENKNAIERTYEFKVGEVTDEDVALPNLSEYTIVE